MKYKYFLATIFLLILAACQPIKSSSSTAVPTSRPDGAATKGSPLVAVIGDVQIDQDELFSQIQFTRYQLVANYKQYKQAQQTFGNYPGYDQALKEIRARLDDPLTLGQAVLDDMVNEVLIRQEASRMGIAVSAEEVETAFEETFNYYAKGTPTPTPINAPVKTPTFSEIQVTLQVRPAGSKATPTPPPAITIEPVVPDITPTPYTFQAYQRILKTQVAYFGSIKFGEDDMRKVIESQLLQKKITEKVLAGQKAEGDQVWARHILVKDEATAADVVRRLHNGENWYSLAAAYSIDNSTKDQGGDLGWFGKGKMVAEFENAAFALNVGETSSPVKTQFGYHIIQILGHEKLPLPAADAEQFIYDQFQKWIVQLRADHNKEIQLFTTWQAAVPKDPSLTAQDIGQ
jgi:peptidyl-prolyl cis-trans isomerase D